MKEKYLTYHVFDKDGKHGGTPEYNFIIISIINFLFAKEKIIRMVEIKLEDIYEGSEISLDLVKTKIISEIQKLLADIESKAHLFI